MQTIVLIVTCGQTDVQLADADKRRNFAKRMVGELHDQLRDHSAHWVVVDAPLERSGEITELSVETPWKLCTPKFDAVLSYLGGTVPDRLLLLETTRNQKREDPRFAGGVLERRAKERGISEVLRSAYLGPDDHDLESRERPEDAIVRRDVVTRLEDAIRNALAGATHVVVAATGGMPEVKALVRELARLHVPAGGKLEHVEVDDGAGKGQPDRAVAREPFDPVEAVRARRRALSLIENGNLLGAWAVAKAIHDERDDLRQWTQVVDWLARFASSLPMPETCDLTVLTHRRMAVRTALRVELALRSKDVPRAVHGTVAFFEAALWDHLGQKVVRHPSKRQFKFLADPPEELVRERDSAKLATLSKTKQRQDRDRPFTYQETSEGSDWYRIDDDKICATKIAKYYLKLDRLTELSQAVSDEIRDLRNDVAHNEPTPKLMDDAERRMQAAGLWSENHSFLSQPLVQGVLRELGESQPEVLCDDLMGEVRTRLLAAAVSRGRVPEMQANSHHHFCLDSTSLPDTTRGLAGNPIDSPVLVRPLGLLAATTRGLAGNPIDSATTPTDSGGGVE